MPTLIILRHAQAVPSRSDDHGRPLTEQGRTDAAAAGRSLQSRLSGSVLVLASDARRTLETAALAFASCAPSAQIRSRPEIYGASPATLLKSIQGLSEPQDVLILVGHNPGISELAKQLVGTGSERDRARVAKGLPTAATAIFNFDGSWPAIALHSGRLTATWAPDGTPWTG